MPFDRLIRAIDGWAEIQTRKVDVLAQIGNSNFVPRHIRFVASMPPSEFRVIAKACDLLIAHAGMGSILTALEFAKPIVILPRRGSLLETRNDHQISTATWLAEKPGIFVAMAEADLPNAIELACSVKRELQPTAPIASPELISAIRGFICA